MKKLIVSGVLAAAVAICGVAAFAVNTQTAPKASVTITEEQREILKEKVKADLAEMLEAEQITEEQYENLLKRVDFSAPDGSGKEPGFGRGKGMHNAPELTEEQKAKMIEECKTKLKEKLDAGEITQEQYDEQIARIENGEFAPMGGRGFGKGQRMGQKSPKEEKSGETETTERTETNAPQAGKKVGRINGKNLKRSAQTDKVIK